LIFDDTLLISLKARSNCSVAERSKASFLISYKCVLTEGSAEMFNPTLASLLFAQ